MKKKSLSDEVKARGMLFTKHMVQAIIDDRKGQTRRPLKSKIAFPEFLEPQFIEYHLARCPYGKPGDWIYARETTWLNLETDTKHYNKPKENLRLAFRYKTTPSLLMPFERARVFVPIEQISIERLTDISEEDAINEGIEETKPGIWKDYGKHYPSFFVDPRKSYFSLWDAINGEKYPSRYNPFVWRIKFGGHVGMEKYLEITKREP